MKFYDNRFDFLRVNRDNFFYNGYAPSTIEEAEEYKDYLLPFGENCVHGSTCLFVDKGDLFIYYKSKDVYTNPNISEFGTGLWFKVGSEEGECYAEGDNPYYSSGDDEPVIL